MVQSVVGRGAPSRLGELFCTCLVPAVGGSWFAVRLQSFVWEEDQECNEQLNAIYCMDATPIAYSPSYDKLITISVTFCSFATLAKAPESTGIGSP